MKPLGHTIGPFVVDYNRRIVSEVTGEIICEVPNRPGIEGPIDVKAHANAEIMAAGPELAQCLSDVLECWEEECSQGDGIMDTHIQIQKRAEDLLRRLEREAGERPQPTE